MSNCFNESIHPHFRLNPLINEWVLVSPNRAKRPWKGKLENESEQIKTNLDQNNPLFPGSIRSNGKINPMYESTFAFDNDFPALIEDVPSPASTQNFFFQIKSAKGKCRVICFHPDSNLTLALMSKDEVINVIQTWIDESKFLRDDYDWIQIFENKGEIMGCSNPHPHCQVWASLLPNEPSKKDFNQKSYFEKNGRPLLMDYLDQELKAKERIIIENNNWVVLIPFWAIWPFETMILPKQHVIRIENLNSNQIDDLADIMKKLLTKYDNIFKVSFPYTMGWQGAPTGQFLKKDMKHWTLHATYYPPLLRSATVKKFMVGYELLAGPQRDITPEQAAQILRSQSEIHYKERC